VEVGAEGGGRRAQGGGRRAEGQRGRAGRRAEGGGPEGRGRRGNKKKNKLVISTGISKATGFTKPTRVPPYPKFGNPISTVWDVDM
jgi:hypothetical protein